MEEQKSNKLKFTLRINSQDVKLKVNPKTPFSQILKQVGESINVNHLKYTYKHNHSTFSIKQTPEELGLEEGDIIEAMNEQEGGQ